MAINPLNPSGRACCNLSASWLGCKKSCAGKRTNVKRKKNAKKIATKAEISQVASISANDPEIGKLISEVFDKVGNEGVITVEKSEALEMTYELTEGMQFDPTA